MNVRVYTFSYENDVRAENMKRRFLHEDTPLEFVPAVQPDDPRLAAAPENVKRVWAIMFNHLDMLSAFVQSPADYGIFCEDDILLRRGFRTFLPEMIAAFDRRKLDVLLLGYLISYRPVRVHSYLAEAGPQFTFHSYPDDLWGSQMYMLSRTSGRRLLDKYTQSYAVATLTDSSLTPFSPDWTLTKDGSRALVYLCWHLKKAQWQPLTPIKLTITAAALRRITTRTRSSFQPRTRRAPVERGGRQWPERRPCGTRTKCARGCNAKSWCRMPLHD